MATVLPWGILPQPPGPVADPTPSRVVCDVPKARMQTQAARLIAEGWRPVTVQAVPPNGKPLSYNVVAHKVPDDVRNWSLGPMVSQTARNAIEVVIDFSNRRSHTFVVVATDGGSSAAGSYGLPPEAHRLHARALAALGFQPTALCAAWPEGASSPVTASLWSALQPASR